MSEYSDLEFQRMLLESTAHNRNTNQRRTNKDNEYKQTNDVHHAQLLPEFEMYVNQNMEKRVSLTIDIINSNKHISKSNKFQIPLNFLKKNKEIIKSSISNWTKVKMESCDSPDKTLEQYKKKAKDKLHKHKVRFFGDYIFEPIIYKYLPKYISTIYSSGSKYFRKIIFIDIFINILKSKVELNSKIRKYPLIPHALIKINTRFKQNSTELLKYFDLSIDERKKNAKDLFANFIERLKDIKNTYAQLMKKEQNNNDNNHISENAKNNYKEQTIDKRDCEILVKETKQDNQHVKVNKLKTVIENEHKTMEEIIKVSREILHQTETEEKSQTNDTAKNNPMTTCAILVLVLGILSIVIGVFGSPHQENDQSPQTSEVNEKQRLDLLEKYQLLHIWPKLCEKRFNDMSLWKDITFDMLNKMNMEDPDIIRFERLQTYLKNSEKSLVGKIAEMCSKNQQFIGGLVKMFPATGLMTSISAIIWWMRSKIYK